MCFLLKHLVFLRAMLLRAVTVQCGGMLLCDFKLYEEGNIMLGHSVMASQILSVLHTI